MYERGGCGSKCVCISVIHPLHFPTMRARQEGELVPDETEPELIPPEQVLVENVVRDPRIKFFGIPKLGAYLALPISYGSWLHPGGGTWNVRVPSVSGIGGTSQEGLGRVR